MKLTKAIIVSCAGLMLGACAVTIADDNVDGWEYGDRDNYDRLTVTLPDGNRDRFSCPPGTSSFVINLKDQGKGMVYGCRTDGTPMPTLEGESGK